MIEVEELSKRFKTKQALDGVSFTAEDGKVTGFLGPNGAGKSTTMRAALGLISPDKGRALIDGKPYVTLRAPMRAVGAVLDAKSRISRALHEPIYRPLPIPTTFLSVESMRSLT